MYQIVMYVDGACMPNPGEGGWGAIIYLANGTVELCGYEARTTNQRMELTAAIRALEHTKENDNITLYSDSQYLIKTMTSNWRRNANRDLWYELDALVVERNITWKWVRGHDGNPGNERADQLAVAAREGKHTRTIIQPNDTTNP